MIEKGGDSDGRSGREVRREIGGERRGRRGDGNQSEGDEGGRRDPGLIPKCTHLILMVKQGTPIKQELHTPIMSLT